MAVLQCPTARRAVQESHEGRANGSGNGAIALEARDAAWLSQLNSSVSARALQDHLACVEDRLDSNGREGSIKEAGCNRESFLAALNESCLQGAPFPCGLGPKMPRFVAIVNLSGKRMLLSSESDTMMRKLCARSWTMHPDQLADQLAQFGYYLERRAEGDASMVPGMTKHDPSKPPPTEFVLITYSLPWQAGISAAYWEISTVCITHTDKDERRVHDRMVTLSSMSAGIFTARPTLSTRVMDGIRVGAGTSAEDTLRFVSDEQLRAFNNAYVAVNLDAPQADTTNATGSTSPPLKPSAAAIEAQLRSLISALRAERIQDQSEIRMLRTTEAKLRLEQEKALEQQNEAAIASIEKAQADIKQREKAAHDQVLDNQAELDRLRSTTSKLLSEQEDAMKRTEEALRRVEKLKKQEASKDKLHNAAAAKQASEIKRLKEQNETDKRAAAEQLADTKRQHSHAMGQLEGRRERDMNALQETLRFKERALNQLVENNDSRLAELEDARERLSEGRERIAELEAERSSLFEALKCAERAAPKSVACGTDSQGTSTHHHNGTQTGNGCIMAEDLPEELQAALPEPPPWAMAASPITTPSSPATPSPVLAPAPMSSVPMAAPMNMPINMPEGVVPQPFGTPQMAMNAAMSSLGHLLSWTQFLEAEATQRNAPAHLNQQLVHPQHLVHPQPHRARR